MSEFPDSSVERFPTVPFLKLIKNGCKTQVIPLSTETMILGRHPSCRIVLDDASVSREHAQILYEQGLYVLKDLHSRNGTQLNRQPIRGRTALHDGDEIKICDFTFIFLLTHNPLPAFESSGLNPHETLIACDPAEEHHSEDIEVFAPEIEITENSQENSAIITMPAGSSEQGLRLNIKPEAKLRAILEISMALGRVVVLSQVLDVILKSLFKIFPQADSGFVLLRDQESDKLHLRGSQSRRSINNDVPISMTVVRQAMETGQAILSIDVGEDRRFQSSESLVDMQLRSLMCTPLMEVGGVALGVMQVSTFDVSQSFHADDLDIFVSVGAQAALAVENSSLHERLLSQREFDRDLEIAAQVQLGFLPSSPPTLDGYEFADYYEAAHSIGGDYYDFIRLPDGRIASVIGDVAGKGIPAALLMARLHASVRYHLSNAQRAELALASLNTEMADSAMGYRFITLSIAILDPVAHEIQLASAGHPPPILRRHGRQAKMVSHSESGMPLGIMRDLKYKSLTIPLGQDDSIVFYTDGITEAMNHENVLFAKERATKSISKGPKSVKELVPALIDDVDQFCEGKPQSDDICVIAIRRL